jgi:hypothetical protein
MFTWRYLDAAGAQVGSSHAFDDREGAEAWMGEEWAPLLERGIEQVVLTDGERTLYRMGLREA